MTRVEVFVQRVTFDRDTGSPNHLDSLDNLTITAFFAVMDDHDQVAACIVAQRPARKNEPAMTLENHLIAMPIAAKVERNPRLAGNVSALIGGLARDVGRLLHRHADLQRLELAVGGWLAKNLALPTVDSLDRLTLLLAIGR